MELDNSNSGASSSLNPKEELKIDSPVGRKQHADSDLHLIDESLPAPSMVSNFDASKAIGVSPNVAREDHAHGFSLTGWKTEARQTGDTTFNTTQVFTGLDLTFAPVAGRKYEININFELISVAGFGGVFVITLASYPSVSLLMRDTGVITHSTTSLSRHMRWTNAASITDTQFRVLAQIASGSIADHNFQGRDTFPAIMTITDIGAF